MRDKKAAGFFHLFTVLGVIFFLIIVVFAYQYFADRPNYRDLEKEYKKISTNIPSDWKLVSESSNKGWFGLFCIQIEGSECPQLRQEYPYSQLPGGPSEILNYLKNIVYSSGYIVGVEVKDKCDEVSIENQTFVCGVIGVKGNMDAYVDVRSKDSHGYAGKWGTLILSKHEM